jgi:hypothetical protein
MIKISPEKKIKIYRAVKVIVLVLVLLCAVKFLAGCGRDEKNGTDNQNTISFTGHGEISAVPDIANIDFTIQKDAKTVKEAQDDVAQVEKASLAFLRTSSVADKDIKTTDASFYPKYEYKYEAQPEIACVSGNCPPIPPPIGNNVIVGYTASENITVKIRNTDDAGKIMQGLGTLGVSNLDGPNFTIDNEDSLKDGARKLAIDDAKAKAKKLANDLGIRLGKITSFSENGNNPEPMYAKAMTAGAVSAPSAPAELPTGQNLITSDVTITYEIK